MAVSCEAGAFTENMAAEGHDESSTKCRSSTAIDDEDVFLTNQEEKGVDVKNVEVECERERQAEDLEVVNATAEMEFEMEMEALCLDFPLTIDIKDIVPDPSNEVSFESNAIKSARSSIERNKILCSGKTSSLTAEEEERVAALLLQGELDMEKYGNMPLAEEERDSELDTVLLGLGFDMEASENADSNAKTRGDPVLAELSKERLLKIHESDVDKALTALMREPLPPVIRIPEERLVTGDDTVSQLQHSCGDSLLTASVTESEIKQLVVQVKKEFEEEGKCTELATHEAVRLLAAAIFDDESSKKHT